VERSRSPGLPDGRMLDLLLLRTVHAMCLLYLVYRCIGCTVHKFYDVDSMKKREKGGGREEKRVYAAVDSFNIIISRGRVC
jgi:hypothetical protein